MRLLHIRYSYLFNKAASRQTRNRSIFSDQHVRRAQILLDCLFKIDSMRIIQWLSRQGLVKLFLLDDALFSARSLMKGSPRDKLSTGKGVAVVAVVKIDVEA